MAWGRKRGAQPGNRNAITHGVYAGIYGPKGAKLLRRAARMKTEDLAHEIAVIRTAARRLADIEPDNIGLLATVMRTLIHAVAVHHGLTPEQETGVHASMVDLLQTLMPATGGA